MGFLDHSTNNIILDAVLTNLGREALSRNDGSFEIFKFAFSDEEVDYGHIVHYGRTVGKEKIEKNTPVLEAVTQGNLAQKYRTRTINNDALTRLPTLTLIETLTNNILTLSRTGNDGNPTSKQMSVQQSLQSGTLDPDLTDFSFRVMADNLFLGISNRVPDSIDDNNIATYTIAANAAITSQNLSTIGVTFFARSVSNDLFDTYKQKGGSVVEKVVTVSGMNSGATLTFRIQIT
tara:strand:- start:22497 stop:23198 length:702 start_codon:yes stop_codon:yes gene_type:complete